MSIAGMSSRTKSRTTNTTATAASPLLTLADVSVLAEGLDHPECVAWGQDGYVYAGGEAGQIYRIGLDGQLTEFASTGGFTLGICLDGDGNIYTCDCKKQAVF